MSDRRTSHAHFANTRWSVVLAGGHDDPARRRAALGELIQIYWYPLYAYLRHNGCNVADAEDFTQGFLTKLMERKGFVGADPARGRFRSYLLASLKHFLINAREQARAAKRGGDRRIMSLDLATAEGRYALEPGHELTPEKLFERRWALTLLETVLERLRREFNGAEKRMLFEALKPVLTSPAEAGGYAETAAALGMTSAAVKTAAHRLKRRYRELLRQQIAETVSTPAEVEEELRHLFAALS